MERCTCCGQQFERLNVISDDQYVCDDCEEAVIYARFSTDHQSDKSIDEQVSDCADYCRLHGIRVVEVFADYAVSGTKSSRPQFDRMMDLLRSRGANVLVCYDQSRLSRDFLNWFSLRGELQSLGVRLISITQEYVGGDIQDSSVLIQETFLALHNQMHVADTRRKVKAALRYRAQMGQHTGGTPPLGYHLENKKLSIDPQEAAVVRRIFTEYDSGRSYREIIDGLNTDGIRTKRGNIFGSNSLHDLLHNERYIGTFRLGGKPYSRSGKRNTHAQPSEDALVLDRPELAIIDKELFKRVQNRMSQNKHAQSGRPATTRDYPLKGKVFCGKCGSAMTVARSVSKGASYYYYRCAAKDRLHTCDGKPIRADTLEDTVLRFIRAILGNADIQSKVGEMVKKEVDSIMGSNAHRLEAKIRGLEDVQKQIDNLVSVLASGVSSRAISDRLKSLEQERDELEAQLIQIKKAAEVAALPSQRLNLLVQQVIGGTSINAMLSIVSRVDVFDDHIEIFTAFDPDDPDSRKPHREELIDIVGDPSGVPRISINRYGILICVGR